MTDCNESHEGKPRILLYHLNQASLLILGKSGVIYQNQTCGVACAQRCEEGYLVPLADCFLVENAPIDTYQCPIEEGLRRMFWGPVQGIDEETASDIDHLLQSSGWTRGLTVDRERMHESEEAWVYVKVAPSELAEYLGFGVCNGVLVWHNSD
jgi:hypothetical protein